MVSGQIRKAFLNYFKINSHTIVPSSSLLPPDDPTLLFTNAGMNQFKDVFLGKSKRSYKRAATTQKCIRAGGKHNDLENVGFTSRHLTFFEMLGNFSFGDYFKKEAIAYAFDLSAHVFGFDPDKIWASVYQDDDEAYELWKKHLPSSRIVRFGEKENFWAMGETGPCGPCSELLYDRGEKYSDVKSPIYDVTGERYLEFWNLVFMQYNKDENGQMAPLPNKCIDTGAGFERVVSLKMGVDTVFATDIFMSLIDSIEEISKTKYDSENKETAGAFHVIADHIRCLAFAIADGIMPSNADRGYVLRKILRRAARYGKMLNLSEPFLAKLLPRLSMLMGEDFPELIASEKRTGEILTLEEEAFIKNLNRGGSLMSQVIGLAKKEKRKIEGEEAFKMKDTYGFPIEEILLLAKDERLEVDLNKFNDLEQTAKERSRQSQEKHFEKFDENFFADFTKTHKDNIFIGHHTFETEAKILGLIQKNRFVDELKEDEAGIIILDKTSFYAEKGGQAGDKGFIVKGASSFKVQDVQNPYPGVIIHIGKVTKGSLKKQDAVHAKIDVERRKKIEANHSATHLLHWALGKVLGEHVKQAGSLVDENRLRFDFDHHKAMLPNELKRAERLVNQKIRENFQIKTFEMSFERAQKDKTIKQIFGEKYSDMVRVVEMAESKELCGGSHCSFTGDIGYFRIFKETSISQGVRRIEAVTGAMAEDFVYDTEDLLNKICVPLKANQGNLEEKLNYILEENKNLLLKLRQASQKSLQELIDEISQKAEKVNSYNFIARQVDMDPKDFKFASDKILSRVKSAIIAFACVTDGSLRFFIKISPDLVNQNFDASDLIKAIAPIIKGGGGGKKDMAQAQGSDIAKINEAFEELKKLISKK